MAKPDIQSAGYLIFCRKPSIGFLLMKHASRWDLPKGRLDPGETIEQAASRELIEETGFDLAEIQTEQGFRYVSQYELPLTKKTQKVKLKALTIFLGWIENARPPILTEHEGFEWIDWEPPHQIQANTIDPLLRFTADYFQGRETR